MQCPVCTRQLTPKLSLETTLYSCPAGCGIWFADGTLTGYAQSMAQRTSIEPAATELFKPRKVEVKPQDDDRAYQCPQCRGTLQKFNYAYDSNVWVNRCVSCSGIWASADEVHRIAQHIKPDEKSLEVGQALAQKVHEQQRLEELQMQKEMSRGAWLRLMVFPKFILPLGDDEECERFPWVTATLITLCVAVFLIQRLWIEESQAFVNRYAFTPSQFWSLGLVTFCFLHMNLWHLLGNMLFLWLFGDNVEDRLG